MSIASAHCLVHNLRWLPMGQSQWHPSLSKAIFSYLTLKLVVAKGPKPHKWANSINQCFLFIFLLRVHCSMSTSNCYLRICIQISQEVGQVVWYFFSFLFFSFIFISWRLITLQYCSGFCHTLTWISHGFTSIPHPDPPSHLSLHPIPLSLPSAPGLSTCLLHPAWAGDLFHPR